MKSFPGPDATVCLQSDASPIDLFDELCAEYGPMFQFRTAHAQIFVVGDTTHVNPLLNSDNVQRASILKMCLGNGLLASDGMFWRRQRTRLQPAFTSAKIAESVDVMLSETQRLTTKWKLAAGQQQVVDVSQDMATLTLRIICRVVFSEDFPCATIASLRAAVDACVEDLGKLSLNTFGLPFTFSTERNRRFRANLAVIDEFCFAQIQRRRAGREDHDDILTLLLAAQTDEVALTDREIRDELATMFIAGHETTSVALGWAWKVLSENTNARTRLDQELDCKLDGVEISVTSLADLSWTRACFLETLRLYPPVWLILRVAKNSHSLGPYQVPKGAFVAVSPWLMHRCARLWPNPLTFNPERFVGNGAGTGVRKGFMPFGSGFHQCVGLRFATLEGCVILAELARHFTVTPLQNRSIKPLPWTTIRQSPSLHAHIVERRG